MFDIRALFTKEAIIRALKDLPPPKTPVMDAMFPDRPTHPNVILGESYVRRVTRILPLIRRGGPSVQTGLRQGGHVFYEPLSFRPSNFVTGADVNNMKTWNGEQKDAWVRDEIDALRTEIRNSTEAMSAQFASLGKIQWPVQVEGGAFDVFEIDFGGIQAVTVTKKWSATGADITDVLAVLHACKAQLGTAGYGQELEIWAGQAAWGALLKILLAVETTTRINLEVTENGIRVPGYEIKLRNDVYTNPQTGDTFTPVPTKEIRVFSRSHRGKVYYCAIDDLDGNLQATPFFVKPVPVADPSGYKLIAESKPFPCRDVRSMCKAAVVE